MASSQLVPWALLLAVLTTVVATAERDYGEYCRVGKSIPINPLPACREYITRRCAVGDQQVPDVLKQQCCRELSDLPESCRCDALSILVNGVITEDGSRVGRMEAVPGCDRERIHSMGSYLTAYSECNLHNPGTPGGDCVLFGGGIS
ncbi:trypsin/amylase inhibitor pUP13 [Hordeum vulgare]|uniref:Bifunctional inhibitor/plant lipid transfer protein/seed storage helical domain-containing protein n=2 Tax=Hordeum vulgare TaxID=4513 RepID=A0A8I6XS48_HORVV|nr:17kDa alpha-amylase/trypsin inhibitor 2-like [Hordeum vulgare subsp. vulgare]KAE8789042.1 trypsin/amylase inhibitor pUP13 [Hordeum vulgare]